ncbi:MAG: hypothetical protein ACR2KV_10765 [Solirubrobacteraceae bacterium]
MVVVVLAHIAGVPVEETLLSVGPALVAAVSVGLVHIRSLRDRPTADTDADADADPDPDGAWDGRGYYGPAADDAARRRPVAAGDRRPDEEACLAPQPE